MLTTMDESIGQKVCSANVVTPAKGPDRSGTRPDKMQPGQRARWVRDSASSGSASFAQYLELRKAEKRTIAQFDSSTTTEAAAKKPRLTAIAGASAEAAAKSPEFVGEKRLVDVPSKEVLPRCSASDPPQVTLQIMSEFESYKSDEAIDCKVVVQLKAADKRASQMRNAVAITCVIDVSGSMAGSKIESVKATALFLVDKLVEGDSLCIIAYNCSVKTLLPLTRVTSAVRSFARDVISRLGADGGTALYDGLVAGMASQVLGDVGQVRAVLMCTDGQGTDGPTTVDAVLNGLKREKERWGPGRDVTVHTFGFGHDHDAKLLQAVAESQGGRYCFLADAREIPAAFGDVLGGLFSTLAAGLRLTLQPLGGSRLASVTSAEQRQPSSQAHVSLRELCEEESQEVLVQLSLPASAPGARSAVLQATLEYQDLSDPAHVTQRSLTCQLELSRSQQGVQGQAPHPLVRLTDMRFKTAAAISQAHAQLEAGRDKDAAKMLEAHVEVLKKAGVEEGKQGDEAAMLLAQTRAALKEMKKKIRTAAEEKERWATLKTTSAALHNKQGCTPSFLTYNQPMSGFYSGTPRFECSSAAVQFASPAFETAAFGSSSRPFGAGLFGAGANPFAPHSPPVSPPHHAPPSPGTPRLTTPPCRAPPISSSGASKFAPKEPTAFGSGPGFFASVAPPSPGSTRFATPPNPTPPTPTFSFARTPAASAQPSGQGGSPKP